MPEEKLYRKWTSVTDDGCGFIAHEGQFDSLVGTTPS